MAISRKQALKRLRGFQAQVQAHLAALTAQPDAPAAGHWRTEIVSWLQQMEEVLPHVGKKTAAEWEEHIKSYQARLRI